ncbi:bifunctional folylpolyglutamate synthase/dihydrofolate synthase [Terricaulis sp.]|uniref:bifunctional folylpolyglutamate synthase/dihydrofolate synthase n=1 Tax=Terricaulis sp. TaxID=2768686 RepID=UPI0037832E94
MNDPALFAFERLFGPEFGHGKPFDLARLRAVLDALGNPEKRLPRVIHVAGTNGKGSTIAFMRAIAEAGGLRVHAFTKPHLLKLNERFVVASEPASDDALIATGERIAAVSSEISQFDAQVAAAMLLFAETPADLTLIEVGMGGRLDSTAVVWSALSVITPIALDHVDALGTTIADIAAHKAGIIRHRVPVVITRQSAEARQVIEARAAEMQAPLFSEGVEWDAFANAGRLVVQTEAETFDLPLPALAGAHQIANAGLAVAALAVADIALPNEAFADGVAKARWPARLQALTRGPFSAAIRGAGGEVWVDAGHNAHAAAALARALTEMRARRGGTNVAVIGLRRRKDAPEFITALARAVDHIIAVPLAEEHIEPQRIAGLALDIDVSAEAAPSLAAAMQNAAQFPAPRVLICGSFLLAGETLAAESA